MLVKLPPQMPREKMVRLLQGALCSGLQFSYPETPDESWMGRLRPVSIVMIENCRDSGQPLLNTFGMTFHFDNDEDAILFKLKYV